MRLQPSRWLLHLADHVFEPTAGRRRRRDLSTMFGVGLVLFVAWGVTWRQSWAIGLLVPALVILAVAASLWLARQAAQGVHAWHNHAVRLAQRRDYEPPRTAAGQIDWSALTDYVAVGRAESLYPARDLEALLTGPLNRYFELSADAARSRPERARTMEFAIGAVRDFKRRRARWFGAARVDAAVMAELEARFGASDRWLIEVYQGLRNHHATGPA